jgi:hypothetical protein
VHVLCIDSTAALLAIVAEMGWRCSHISGMSKNAHRPQVGRTCAPNECLTCNIRSPAWAQSTLARLTRAELGCWHMMIMRVAQAGYAKLTTRITEEQYVTLTLCYYTIMHLSSQCYYTIIHLLYINNK